MKKVMTLTATTALAVSLFSGAAVARDQIRIVGSSTVFPFATAVAEQFGKSAQFKTPVVESTGSGGGMKLFCAGVGVQHPDVTNASRRIKKKEFDNCVKNGVTPVEVKIGFDGIVLANSKKADKLALTKKTIFLALAKYVPDPKNEGKLIENPYKKWSDIDASLPNSKIEVLGPPPTSGTRDAFVELAMEGGAKKFGWLKALRGAKAGEDAYKAGVKHLDKALYMKDGKEIKKGKSVFKQIAHSMREDGHFIEAGENDNLIIQKLEANPAAVGIFGFSFLDQNADKVQGATVDGASPTFEKIASGEYGVSRSLFFYIKKEHVGTVPGIAEYATEFTSNKTWGDDGYLVDKGLIPLPKADREKFSKDVKSLTPLTM
ncbi:MAG: phosphate ABC transporter substrate-binding protein [Rhodomicrobium sp.]|nr:MAG: phosphate ABC transporter substrate-binding protein [Rhodomicrobium sp.]